MNGSVSLVTMSFVALASGDGWADASKTSLSFLPSFVSIAIGDKCECWTNLAIHDGNIIVQLCFISLTVVFSTFSLCCMTVEWFP